MPYVVLAPDPPPVPASIPFRVAGIPADIPTSPKDLTERRFAIPGRTTLRNTAMPANHPHSRNGHGPRNSPLHPFSQSVPPLSRLLEAPASERHKSGTSPLIPCNNFFAS